MEALAAIGLASNVLQFIEVGYKAIRTSKEMYGAGNEASRSNKELATITEEMQGLSLRLTENISSSGMTDDEKAMCRLAQECERWSSELLAFLDVLKNRNPRSRFEALKAVVRSMRKQDERIRLERGLDACRKQLELQLTSMSRSEVLQTIGDLSSSMNEAREDMAVLRRTVKLLHKSVDATSISPESLDRLRDILQISDQALLRSRQNQFLKALRFEGMQDRFSDVVVAHSKTFEWLLEDVNAPGKSDNGVDREETISDPLIEALDPNFKPQKDPSPQAVIFRKKARERFTHWLKHDRGIFHIAGKPGAGKSTLMKFLCKSQVTMRYLEEWSGGKTVVFAKSFFWRLGSSMQKSLSGLIRSLLYQVLSSAPGLIPLAFPSLWKQTVSTPGIQIEFEELEWAFKNLMANQEAFKRHKMVFFIDGLDEYEGRHIDIVRQFFDWTSSHPEDVKMCVSSREWNEFVVGFAECPKLRIHECTHEDIIRFVTDRIDTHCHYLTLVSKEDMELLTEEIVRKAEGVFLWVRLVLTAVEDGVLDGDGASDLKSKVNAFPTELGKLYEYLFDSIPVTNRRKAFEALRITHHISLDRGLPLLRYWSLNDVMADPDFAMKMPMLDSKEGYTAQLLRTTRRQIYGRCKGFLEVYPSKIKGEKIEHLPDDGEVRYMHSTVHEFLEDAHIKEVIEQFIGGVDVFDRICQTFLANVKFGYQEQYYSMPEYGDTAFNQDLAAILAFATQDVRIFPPSDKAPQSQRRFLSFLDALETAAIPRLTSKGENRYRSAATKDLMGTFYISSHEWSQTHPSTLVQAFAISSLLHEFLQKNHPEFLVSTTRGGNSTHDDGGADDLVMLLLGLVGTGVNHRWMKELEYSRLYEMLKLCFARGVSPNYVTQRVGKLSLFERIIYLFLFDQLFVRVRYGIPDKLTTKRQVRPFRLLKLCLFYGAKSNFQLIFGPVYRTNRNLDVVEVQGSTASKYVAPHDKKDMGWFSRTMFIPRELPIVAFAEKHQWILTFRNLVEFWFPTNYEVLQHFIDTNNDSTMSPGSKVQPLKGQSIWEDDYDRDWAEVEIGERIFPPRTLVSDIEEFETQYEMIFDPRHSSD
ncbi:hypothetical protein F5B20DRAFT_540427 [Whalleya microplaca]|nr:hypothetical protein F5B20DRAFT_540427 [Whalleya microplaca]